MSLTSVQVGEEVWLTCLSHALTTETEEVMGLLLGDIKYSSRGAATALIWGASPQMRSERKKDRVEVNPELLAAASAQAERLTASIGRTTRVIGWYHSHPHITVLPSHVDVRTQAMFQLLDQGFIGLIFSCFSEDAQKVGRIQVIAFQSLDGKQQAITPVATNSVIDLEVSMSSSDNAVASGSALLEGIEQDTGDSRATKSSKVWGITKQETRDNTIVVYNPDNTNETSVDLDDSDMTPSMQEALHRSNMDISGAEYVRKEVPLHVFPTRYLLKLETPLTSYCDMHHILFGEERSAYNQAMHQNIRDGEIHPLTSIHHTSTYTSSLCKLMEYCLSPAVLALQDRLKENEHRGKHGGRPAAVGRDVPRTGSSGPVWEDRYLSGELKPAPAKGDDEERARPGRHGGYRAGSVPPALDPPSPRVAVCGFCKLLGNGKSKSREDKARAMRR